MLVENEFTLWPNLNSDINLWHMPCPLACCMVAKLCCMPGPWKKHNKMKQWQLTLSNWVILYYKDAIKLHCAWCSFITQLSKVRTCCMAPPHTHTHNFQWWHHFLYHRECLHMQRKDMETMRGCINPRRLVTWSTKYFQHYQSLPLHTHTHTHTHTRKLFRN